MNVFAIMIVSSSFQVLRQRSSDGINGEFGASHLPSDGGVPRQTIPLAFQCHFLWFESNAIGEKPQVCTT